MPLNIHHLTRALVCALRCNGHQGLSVVAGEHHNLLQRAALAVGILLPLTRTTGQIVGFDDALIAAQAGFTSAEQGYATFDLTPELARDMLERLPTTEVQAARRLAMAWPITNE